MSSKVWTSPPCSKTQCVDGVDGVHGALVASLCGTFALVTTAFAIKVRLWRHLHTTFDDTHSVEALASWMTKLHERRVRPLGHDIEHTLAQLAHRFDFVVFSAPPLQCLVIVASRGPSFWPPPPLVQCCLVLLGGTGLALVVLTTICTKHFLHLKRHVLLPLCCECLYAVQIAGCVHAALCPATTCAATSTLLMQTTSDCSSTETWLVAIGGIVGMAALYYLTLEYKWHQHDRTLAKIYSVAPVTAALDGMVRTGAVLLHGLIFVHSQSLEPLANHWLVTLLYSLVLVGLWRHHYRLQPFRGDGYSANNLCAATFASATYLSLVATAAIGPFSRTFQESPLAAWTVALTPYPGVLVAASLLNATVAVDVAVPIRSVSDALDAPSIRVRSVAACCLTLDDCDLAAWTPDELMDIWTKLQYFDSIDVSDLDGRAMAYALAATWKLCSYMYDLTPVAQEDDDARGTSVPRHMWVHSTPPSCFESAKTKRPTSVAVHGHLGNAHAYAVAMIEVPNAKAQFAVARTLQEMFAAGVGPLDLPTLLRVVCTLCGADDASPDLASSAARTLERLCAVYSPVHDILPVLMTDDALVRHLLVFLQRAKGATHGRVLVKSAEILAHLLRLIAKHIQDMALNPTDYLPDTLPALLQGAWSKWQDQYFVSTALEDMCLAVHRASETFTTLHAARVAMSKASKVAPHGRTSSSLQELRQRMPLQTLAGSTFVGHAMWQDVMTRQALREEFAAVVQGLLHQGFESQLSPADLTARGHALLERVLGMIQTSPTLLLGHLHDSFTLSEVAYVRHLQLLVQLQRSDDDVGDARSTCP